MKPSSTNVVNRKSAANRAPERPPPLKIDEDSHPPDDIFASDGTPSKVDRRATVVRALLAALVRRRRGVTLILLTATPLFLIARLLTDTKTRGGMVDVSFLGGPFLVGLDVDGESHRSGRFPIGWQKYSYRRIRRHFRCSERSNDNSKPLPTLEDWEYMRDKFTEVVDRRKRWDDDPVPPTLGYSLERGVPVPPPYYAKASPGKGRGLFASRYIAEGELVHDGTRNDVIFPDAVAWRRFVFSLPREMACDSTDWHWMQRLEEGGSYYLLAGLNISSLMNSGGIEFGPGRLPNTMPESSTSGRFYAVRDIAKGEEILTDYDAYYTNWKVVGL